MAALDLQNCLNTANYNTAVEKEEFFLFFSKYHLNHLFSLFLFMPWQELLVQQKTDKMPPYHTTSSDKKFYDCISMYWRKYIFIPI